MLIKMWVVYDETSMVLSTETGDDVGYFDFNFWPGQSSHGNSWDDGEYSSGFDNVDYTVNNIITLNFFDEINTAFNTDDLIARLQIFANDGSLITNSIAGINYIDSTYIDIELNQHVLENYSDQQLWIEYDPILDNILSTASGSNIEAFDSTFWLEDSSVYESGLDFDSAFYDSGADMLRIQLMGEIDTAMSSESTVRDYLRIYSDSSYDSTYEIPNAITSVMFMGNSIEIALDNSVLSDYTAPAGSDLYIKFNGMGGELVAMDGSDLMFFESSFWYQEDSSGGDASGGAGSGSATTYFDFVDYDSDNGDIRFVFYGERLNQFINDSYDIQNRFQILDQYGYEIPGAIQDGFFIGDYEYVLETYDGALSSYSGQNLYINYQDYTEGYDDSWGVLESYDGSDLESFSTDFYYSRSFDASGGDSSGGDASGGGTSSSTYFDLLTMTLIMVIFDSYFMANA